MRHMPAILAAVCALAVIPLGCGRGRAAVTVAGSTAFQPFAEQLAEQFMQAHPEVRITVQGGGSAVGIQSALSGAAQLGMADLVELPADAKALNAVVVARDGIAIVVNPKNPAANLTLDQVRDIFNGRTRRWSEVGGADQPITVVSREAGSGTRSSFEQIVKKVELTQDAIVQDSNGTIRETVANDANAVGYLSHGLLSDKIKALTIDGQACTTEAILAGEYKLVRPIFLLCKGEATGDTKAFLDYVLTPESQTLIQKQGLLPAVAR